MRIFNILLKQGYKYCFSKGKHDYVKPIPKLNKCKYGISYRGPFIWNKSLTSLNLKLSLAVTKSKLLSVENEVSFF